MQKPEIDNREQTPIIVGETKDEKLKRFIKDLKEDADIMTDVRRAARKDMRFVTVDGGHWEDYRENETEGRAKWQFDVTNNPINTFVGEWSQNKVGVLFKPDDSKTSEEDAKIKNSIYRGDHLDGFGKMVKEIAVREAVICGFGAYQQRTAYRDEEDPEDESQRVLWDEIHNAYDFVFFDRASKKIDKRDARWVNRLDEYTKDSFEREFPDQLPKSAYIAEDCYGNYSTEEKVFVSTRYEVIKKKEEVYIYSNIQTGLPEVYDKKEHEEIQSDPKSNQFLEFSRKKTIVKRYIEKTVFSGDAILKETRRVAGKRLPIIPVYGYRNFVDGVEWYRGMVRNVVDPQRALNTLVSQMGESATSQDQQTPVFTPEQIAGHEENWADRINKPYQLINPIKDANGGDIPAGPVAMLAPSPLDQNSAALINIVQNFVQNLTGGSPQDTLDPEASGKAINAIIKRENLRTQIIHDNIAYAIEWEGRVYSDIFAEIYTTPRTVRTVSEDGAQGITQLMETGFDQKTGRPIIKNDLTGKKFAAYADVGPAYETQREEEVENSKELIKIAASSPATQHYVPILFASMLTKGTGVQSEAVKEMARMELLLTGFVSPENEEEEQIIAQAQQPKTDPNTELIAAVSEKERAEARQLDASSMDKVAGAEKKNAETAKIISETENSRIKTLMEIRKQTLEGLKSLPIESSSNQIAV